MPHIPTLLLKPSLWLDAEVLGGAVRRSVRNYSGIDPERLAGRELPPGSLSAVLRGVVRERKLSPAAFIHSRCKPRFVGATTGRSGTTWLQNVLSYGLGTRFVVVREMGLFDLSQFRGASYEYFQYANLRSSHVYRRYFRDFILDRAYFIRRRLDGTLLGLCDLVPRRVVAAALSALDVRLEASRSLDECEQAFGDFYRWLFNAHAQLVSGEAEWISKEPPYGRHADELLRMIPDGKLVVLVRDGRDVALSMHSSRWHPSVEHAIDRWRHFTSMTREALERCPEDRVRVVRYEDLVESFEQELRGICEFLDLPVIARAHLDSLGDLHPRARSVGRWRHEMSERDCYHFNETCGELMRSFGLRI